MTPVTQPPLLKRHELAERVGYAAATIRKWERDGLPVARRGRVGSKVEPSLYDEAAVRAWLKARDAGRLDLEQARARKEHWQARVAEQTHHARANKLLPADDVAKVWGAERAAVRARLLALPRALAPRLQRASVLEGEAGVERALHGAVREVLLGLAGQATGEGRNRRKGRAA